MPLIFAVDNRVQGIGLDVHVGGRAKWVTPEVIVSTFIKFG